MARQQGLEHSSKNMVTSEFFAIDAKQLEALEIVTRRLYTEDRLTGDEMRNLAHVLEAIVRVVKQMPIP